MAIYSKSSGVTNAVIGKLETPIKMIIENESDLMKKKGGICDWLFNVEKSNHFGETIVSQTGFNMFDVVSEGEAAKSDTIVETGSKFIEHLQFMKEFTITAEMMEDANYGIASEAKRRIQNFVKSYYKTINKICEMALYEGNTPLLRIGDTMLDLTTADSMPLFHASHMWGLESGTKGFQANYFWGFNLLTDPSGESYDVNNIERTIYALANIIRGMKDDNGEVMGYVADTIILPGNKPVLERFVKKICGSENTVGCSNNDINIHYGNWNIIILPSWAPTNNEIMVMSSEANKTLAGNMFFNRVPLTVSSWVDHHTGNYNWTGRCRFGIGFGNYRHIVRAVDCQSAMTEGKELKL